MMRLLGDTQEDAATCMSIRISVLGWWFCSVPPHGLYSVSHPTGAVKRPPTSSPPSTSSAVSELSEKSVGRVEQMSLWQPIRLIEVSFPWVVYVKLGCLKFPEEAALMQKPPAHEYVCESIMMMMMILFRGEKHDDGSDSDNLRIFTHPYQLLSLRGLSLMLLEPWPGTTASACFDLNPLRTKQTPL